MDRLQRWHLAVKEKMIICDNFYIFQDKNFNSYKKELISCIERTNGRPYGTITKTNWDGVNYYHEQEYWQIMFPFFKKCYDELGFFLYSDYYKHVSIDWGYSWFQIYEKNSYHSYHTHPNSHFSSVFFVQLPDKKVSTEFLNYQNSYDANEGDLIIFPSYMMHRSPSNNNDISKIIVSFNVSYNCNKKN